MRNKTTIIRVVIMQFVLIFKFYSDNYKQKIHANMQKSQP